MDKNCEKIHYIAPNIYCCGAGTAADTENTTGWFNWYNITLSIPN
jgi:20S proteasome alpha/beta subunit